MGVSTRPRGGGIWLQDLLRVLLIYLIYLHHHNTRVDQLLSLWNCGARGLFVVLNGQLPPHRIIWINIRGLTLSLSGFNGCGTQDQNSADGQHSGVRRDHLVLGLLQDPGPIRRARSDREAVGSETARQDCQSYELLGQTVHSQTARATRRCRV